MPRIYDYESYNSDNKKKVTSEYTFSCELEYLDVDVINRPPEVSDIDGLDCEVEYTISIDRNKKGINDINFQINNIELEIKTDDYPNEPNEIELDIVPDENIPLSSVHCRKLSKLIPSKPSKAVIDMKKSMNPKDFRIEVFFGENE